LARAEEVFFFEKKNQKTFTRLDPGKLNGYTEGGESAVAKVFWFFFSKKNISFSFTGNSP
jgi:hypothetical protein